MTIKPPHCLLTYVKQLQCTHVFYTTLLDNHHHNQLSRFHLYGSIGRFHDSFHIFLCNQSRMNHCHSLKICKNNQLQNDRYRCHVLKACIYILIFLISNKVFKLTTIVYILDILRRT